MSAFADLIAEAEALGVHKLTWTCDVKTFAAEREKPGRWTCRASTSGDLNVAEGIGRTGEEALRVVVGFLGRAA